MRPNSFNVVQLAIALFLAVMVVTVAIAVSDANTRRPHRRMQNSTQLRGIHQGLVTYANSNNNWFPGIDYHGEDQGISVETRFQILLEDDYITPEYAISPTETEDISEWEMEGPITKGNYSYAMLQIPEQGGRRTEWSQTLNSQAIVLSDRNTGTKARPISIHNDENDTDWRGSVLWNDNHVGFENTDSFETFYGEPKQGDRELNPDDRLFVSPGTDDALLIHTGN